MSNLFSPNFRDQLASPNPQVAAIATQNEFDNLSARLSTWGLIEHNEDGTHNFIASTTIPIGGMIQWPTTTPPSKWLVTNGAAISRVTYSSLFQLLGISKGAGDGVNTFNLPNVANFIIYAGV